MKTRARFLFVVIATLCFSSCFRSNQAPSSLSEEDFPNPPVAAARPDTFTEFGNIRIDPYFWLKEKENPEVLGYLKAENNYCDTVMSHTKKLQETLFTEMKNRIKEDDQSVPVFENGYYYYIRTVKDQQYEIHCRRKGETTATEEVIFDVNRMAEQHDAFVFGGYEVSPDNRLAAFAFNTTGSSAEFELRIKELATDRILNDSIKGISTFAWANDCKTLFYTSVSKSLRPYRVYRHIIGDRKQDKMVFEESDELFNVGIVKSKTKEYLFIRSESFNTSEVRMIPAGNPESKPVIFLPRNKNVEYEVQHHKSCFYIRYKAPHVKNGMVYRAPLEGYGDTNNWQTVIPHNPEVRIQDISVFESFIGLFVRTNGLSEIRILYPATGETEKVTFPEPVYMVFPGSVPEYTATAFRYNYSSLNRPWTTYDYDTQTKSSRMLKMQEIPGGFHPDDYIVERLWATAPDGVKVPMAIVYKTGLKKNGKNPALLEGYGSYGYSTDANFRLSAFSLIDRGFVYGIAQVRGGSEMGEQWYEDGKMMKKMNTFTDFIACSEKLVEEKITSPSRLGIKGGSAGGLLMGAVVNMRPDLFHAVLAEVPFVDVINTMLDETLPLTTQEYEQWGNPHEEEAYRTILSYSPYDNIKGVEYPNILATAGLNDSQVSYHEPAKWVAKLRAMKKGSNIILLKINMESGHGGATGRYDRLKETAFQYAFLLDRMGIKE